MVVTDAVDAAEDHYWLAVLLAYVNDACDSLALQSLAVEASFAGDHQVTISYLAVEPELPCYELHPTDDLSPASLTQQRQEASNQRSGGASPREV